MPRSMPPDHSSSRSSPQGSLGKDGGAPVAPRLEQTIRLLARRSLQAVFLGVALRWAAGASLVAGVLILLLRTVYQVQPDPAWGYSLPLSLGLAAGFRRARRSALTHGGAATWIDVHAGGSGLIVTGIETGDSRWSGTFEGVLGKRVALPRLRIGKPLKTALGGAAFLSLALFVRIPSPTPGPSPAFVQALTETLADKFQVLTDNVQLDDALLEELAARLARLTDLAEDAPTESLFEALDRLEERFAAEGTRAATLAQEALDFLGAGLESGDLASPLARSALEQALGRLREAGLGAALPAAFAGLLGEDLELPAGLELDPARWAEISGELAGLLEGSLGELARAGLLEFAQQELASKFARFGKLLDQEDGALDPLGVLALLGIRGSGAGRGGFEPERIWGTEAEPQRLAFESEALSKAEFLDARHSGVIGHATRPAAGEFPKVAPKEESAGLVEVRASTGRSAWRRRLAPRHRNAVRTFFGTGAAGEAQRLPGNPRKDGR